MLSVVLALAASVSWGVSDFLGGLNSRTLAVATVLFFTQLVGLVLLAPIALSRGLPEWQPATVGAAMAGSVAGLVGIAALYQGMAIGTVSIVAPISATGAGVPVLFGLLRGERATLLQSIGIGLALVGIVLASLVTSDKAEKHGRFATDAGFGLLAAIGFGGFFVLLHEASVQDVFWATTIQRLTGTCLLALIGAVTRPHVAIGWPRFSRLAVVGALDATANVLYAFASTTGLVSLAAVLASLFPVVTVILARAVLHERLSRVQTSGVLCALTGVACIALQ